jgi:hypothetical protein
MQIGVVEPGSAIYEHQGRSIPGPNYLVVEFAARAIKQLAFFVKGGARRQEYAEQQSDGQR